MVTAAKGGGSGETRPGEDFTREGCTGQCRGGAVRGGGGDTLPISLQLLQTGFQLPGARRFLLQARRPQGRGEGR